MKIQYEIIYINLNKLIYENISETNLSKIDDLSNLCRALVESSGWNLDDFNYRMIVGQEVN